MPAKKRTKTGYQIYSGSPETKSTYLYSDGEVSKGTDLLDYEDQKSHARPSAHWRPWRAVASFSQTPNASESGKPRV